MLETPTKQITLLMAEDDDDDFFLASEALKEAKILSPLRRVKNGEELLNYLNAKAQFDDREALALIKSDERLKQTPIVILTTSKSEEDIIESYALGTNSYMRKPVTFDSFVLVMKAIGKYWLEVVDLPNSKDSK